MEMNVNYRNDFHLTPLASILSGFTTLRQSNQLSARRKAKSQFKGAGYGFIVFCIYCKYLHIFVLVWILYLK